VAYHALNSSGAEWKLGLTLVRWPNLLSTLETLGNWTDGHCYVSTPHGTDIFRCLLLYMLYATHNLFTFRHFVLLAQRARTTSATVNALCELIAYLLTYCRPYPIWASSATDRQADRHTERQTDRQSQYGNVAVCVLSNVQKQRSSTKGQTCSSLRTQEVSRISKFSICGWVTCRLCYTLLCSLIRIVIPLIEMCGCDWFKSVNMWSTYFTNVHWRHISGHGSCDSQQTTRPSRVLFRVYSQTMVCATAWLLLSANK